MKRENTSTPSNPDPLPVYSPKCNAVIKLACDAHLTPGLFFSQTDGSNKPFINFGSSPAPTIEQAEKQAPLSTVTVDWLGWEVGKVTVKAN